MRLAPIIRRIFKQLATRIRARRIAMTLASAGMRYSLLVGAAGAFVYADDAKEFRPGSYTWTLGTNDVLREFSWVKEADQWIIRSSGLASAPDAAFPATGVVNTTNEAEAAQLCFVWVKDTTGNLVLKQVNPKNDVRDGEAFWWDADNEGYGHITVNYKTQYGDLSAASRVGLTWRSSDLDPANKDKLTRRLLESNLEKTDDDSHSFYVNGNIQYEAGQTTPTGKETCIATSDPTNALSYNKKSENGRGTVFYIKKGGTMGNISGEFIRNNFSNNNGTKEAEGRSSEGKDPTGGAVVFNEAGTVGDISGYFLGNYVKAEFVSYSGSRSDINGGTIYNSGKMGSVSGTFIDNYAIQLNHSTTNKVDTWGAVIYNSYEASIKEISGVFVGNCIVTDPKSEGLVDTIGGVIHNYGKIEQGVHGIFVGNFAQASNTANSGVVRNYGTVDANGINRAVMGAKNIEIDGETDAYSMSGTYIGNYTRGGLGDAYGGIMRNNGELGGYISGDYYGNYAVTDGRPSGLALNPANRFIYEYTPEFSEDNYRYDYQNAKYVSWQEDKAAGTLVKDEAYNLIRRDVQHFGRDSGMAQGGAFYNTIKADGSLTAAEAPSLIAGFKNAKFIRNYALSSWGIAYGGAIYNQDATVKEIVKSEFTGNYVKSLVYAARGGAIYNYRVIRETMVGDVNASFTANYAEGKYAEGGAIYVSAYATMGQISGAFTGNYAAGKFGMDAADYPLTSKDEGYDPYLFRTEDVTEIDGDGNVHVVAEGIRARGGALFVGDFGEVGAINADFTGNYTRSDEEGAHVRGGAILVTKQGRIGHIANVDQLGNSTLAKFEANYAWGKSVDLTYGGAIRFDDSVIGTLSANFTNNWTNGSGGALSLTDSGFIYEVTGNFIGNKAGVYGGAVHNLGTIGYLGSVVMNDNTLRSSLVEISDYEQALHDDKGRVVTRSDETQTANKEGYKELDGSIRGGFVNASFIGNEVNGNSIDLVEQADGSYVLADSSNGSESAETRNGARGLGGAIYTTDNLFITANETDADSPLRIQNNSVVYHKDAAGADYVKSDENGVKRLNTALYVDSRDWTPGSDPIAIYLVATEGAKMVITDAIRGVEETDQACFVLRLRGFTDKDEAHQAPGGTIYLSGPVAQSYAIMDDVQLQLGICTNYFSFGEQNNLDGYRRPGDTYEYGRSDVFRKSHLSVRSGNVDLTADDGQLTQFVFNSLISYGDTYRYADNATNDQATKDIYSQKNLYATWTVDIDSDVERADLITTFVTRDAGADIQTANETAESKGRITLSAINIKHGNDVYTYTEGGTMDHPIADESTIKVQILNLVVKNAAGDIYSAQEYEKLGYLTDKSPLQLDNKLNIFMWEKSTMKSTDILAADIRLESTRTYHDSIELIGWRDNLAAWAEMTDDTRDSRYNNVEWLWTGDSAATQTKVFILAKEKDTHDLTRDVYDLKSDKATPSDGAVWGKDWTIRGEHKDLKLNLNEKNLLTIVKDGQKARLEYFTLMGLKGGRMLNEGDLTLDSMKTADALTTFDNRQQLTLQGHMTIDKSIAITTGEEAEPAVLAADAATDWKQMYIDDRTEVSAYSELPAQKTLLNVTEGAISKQDITHRGSALKSSDKELTPEILADDNYTTVTKLLATGADGKATAGFTRFTQNSLTMEGGKFDLGNMKQEILQLRGLHMKGGLVYVAASDVDLANEKMGGLRGETAGQDNASYSGGVIWLDKINLLSDGKDKVTHVKFVTEGAGDAVRDNHIRNNTAEGKIWKYAVTYNDPSQINSRGEAGRNGYYTFVRMDEVAPSVQVGAVAQQVGGVISLMQMNEYVFEHADLFSANMYNAQRARLYDRSYTVVTPMKGKDTVEPEPARHECSYKAAFKGGMWVRPYAGFEKLPLSNGPKVTNNTYGALVGGDTDVTEYRNGWASVFSVHAAYLGSTQRYSGDTSHVRIQQNGGAVGLTETLYRKGFYTALTATLGTSAAHASTTFGPENFHMQMGGVASRSGYNIELVQGKVTLQPTLLMSYSFVNVNNYTNASGTRVSSKPQQVFQVNPALRLVANTESCWQPFVSVGYVHNFMGKTKFRADGVALPEMSIDPYIEYTLGAQRSWADKYTIFGQVTGRSCGRNGVEFSTGIRWAW